MELFKWGIIGPGNIAETFIGDMPLASSGSHTANVVLHKSKEKAAAFADKFSIGTSFDSIHDMVRAGGMDAVYIATPHPFHHKETLICLEHGIPVLCEKPLAINAVQVKEMIDTARRMGTFLMEGMWIRFLPSIIQVLDLLKKGTIGEIVSMHANLSYVAPREPDSRYFDPERGGGSLLDLGIYPIYLAVLLLGRPVITFARAKVNSKQIDEHCVVTMEFSKKKWAVCESSLISFTGNMASIHGTLGSIHIPKPWNEKPSAIELVDNEGNITRIPCGWEGHGLQFEMDEVYNCVQKKLVESALLPHSVSLCVMELLDAIRQETGIVYPFDTPVPAGQLRNK